MLVPERANPVTMTVRSGSTRLGRSSSNPSFASAIVPRPAQRITAIGAQLVRPDITQSWMRESARMCCTSHQPPATSTTTTISATTAPAVRA